MLKKLFTPIKVGKMELKNRIVMPAMHYLSSWEGLVLPHHTDYFVERAKGGVALIIIGGCTIDETSGAVNMLSVRDDKFIPGLSALAKAVQAQGAKIAAQLYHAGQVLSFHAHGRKAIGLFFLRSVPSTPARLRGSCRSRRSSRSRGIMPSPPHGLNGRGSMPWK